MIRKDNRTNKEICGEIDKLRSKEEIRKYILNLWLEEKPDTQYRYFVEKFTNKNKQEKRIYLERPANLNKGCDFVIYCEDLVCWKNTNDKPPKHNLILDDIKDNKSNSSNLKKSIECIFNCKSYQIASKNLSHLQSWNNGLSYELILKLVKWYFIEQDITYWLKTGRNMLYDAITKISNKNQNL